MESFLAGRPSVSKTHSPSDTGATASAISSPSAMNMDAFESLFAPTAAGNPSAGALADAAACQKAPGGGGPNVEVVRENGVVRRVIITCGCGERIELECDY